MKKYLLIIFVFIAYLAFGQIRSDSLEYVLTESAFNRLNSRFDKQLNTYSLNTFLFVQQKFENVFFTLGEQYNSTLIKSTDRSQRDEQRFSLTAGYEFTPNFNIGFGAHNNIYSNNRRIEINEASNSDITILPQYKPHPKIIITPFFGYSNNRQIGENDYGYLYGSEGLINNLDISDFIIYSEIKFKNEDVFPRSNKNRYANFLLTNNFSPDVNNVINIVYQLNRKDFYYQADSLTSKYYDITNNIQSRNETNYVLQDRLQYNEFLGIFYLDLLGKVGWRKIDRDTRYKNFENISTAIFDTRIEELKFEFESIASYNSESFSGALRFILSERDEKNIAKDISEVSDVFYEQRNDQEKRKNNNSVRASLSLSGLYKITKNDILTFSLFQNKLKYDTPSAENFDDRDELLSIAGIRYTRVFSPFFESFITAEGTFNHTVYVFAEKSSNNNLNRTIRLTAGGIYRGKNISSLNLFEVSANYTVYDFEDLNPNYKSFSFRQYTATDSTTIKLTKKLNLNLYGYIKLSEQGDFKWSAFTIRPTRYLKEIFAEPKLSVRYNDIILASGVRFFSLLTFNYKKTEKILDTEYVSSGPVAEIIVSARNNLLVKLYGWYEFIRLTGNNKKEQTNFSLQVFWNF
ncbi:MAG: hypothetical protein AUK34_02580 [Ignavibacteria bacterium CG2_30_36_16]|nr:MAG: hypothetical protein AUK34_02580 [Ignavibacteria bacterium CG2_30_36_16]PJB00228.1 MAG: hypothetical protein CO127_08990 [Ignavibacteria bacterium CG_4_9_14_3_um_filter_36_18]